ncbi:type IV toxin-antitoxin system AbiEi family antitoxin domain-containing protein [Arthrobacter sp. RT-1]|uniref:type IV toxin-antitoxin system AbiEi family antitoxin domain-containing protein n=1 Tax=Arthrobacter sp. RT-1 TaxID=2292263 RepID=UPI002161BD11|nr:type IV toxin-antitoxin system AbiEi family antitoxin domain-containing protein [Arthrobacter sp. RT-1]
MNPAEILRSAGGVLLTRDVLTAGATEARLRQAVRSGDVVRLERGLLAVADADPASVAAGRARGSSHVCPPHRHSASGGFVPPFSHTTGKVTDGSPPAVSVIGFH